MRVISQNTLVEDIFSGFAERIGVDLCGYKNHVYRLLSYFSALTGNNNRELPDAVLIASVFHDIGIWTAGTFDYLAPSMHEAASHLSAHQRDDLQQEVGTLIGQHHKIRRYRGDFFSTVEPFRKADLVDVSLGLIRFGIPASFLDEVQRALPNAGFHARLGSLALRRCIHQPISPLPMLRW